MTKKQIILCVASFLILVGCKKITVDFTYSPAEPKAGETVTFTNNSSAGEKWAWSFGDNATSLTKSPKKIYKKPGTYMVTLMVDSAKNQTRSKQITVYDTIPTYTCSSDSILHYHDVTFMTNIYNPFSYELTYQWTLPENCILVHGDSTSRNIVVYFTEAGEYTIKLFINQNNKPYNVSKTWSVHNTKAPAIVMRKTDKTVVRQRMINDRIEQVTQATSEDVYRIEQKNDTTVRFNEETFYAGQMSTLVPGFAGMTINHVQIDAMAQKWYITTSDGLFVANFDGSNIESIDPTATGAIHVDASRNRLYWASNTGVYAMALIKSKNNKFTTSPIEYNNLGNVDLITVNNKLQ